MTKAIIKTLLSKVLNTPLVIEQGTVDTWMYRKWSDGRAEAWGHRNRETYSITTVYGYGYYGALTQFSFPPNVFTGVRGLQLTPIDTSGTWTAINSITNDYVSWYPFCSKSGQYPVSYDFYVDGTWK